MQTRVKKYSKVKALLTLAATVLLLLIGSSFASAAVTGTCGLCHTMHNSQNGSDQASSGTGAGWNADASSTLASGASTAALATLLKSDCVGCHSSTTGSTTINMNASGNLVPIVFNTTGYPANPLAGGNFYFTSTGAAGNNYGHNVRGIALPETGAMALAPGSLITCAGGCHTSLAIADPTGSAQPVAGVTNYNGCRGCHTRVAHHNGADTSYRFLGGHLGGMLGEVQGIEDPDWESETTVDHNLYLRSDAAVLYGGNMSIGRFCAGCHFTFHAQGIVNEYGENNGGDPNTDNIAGNNPWLRHPTNVDIPNDATSEYIAIFGAGKYNPLIPVAKPLAGNPTAVEPGDQVMCLSCHRAHASDRPDALRFISTTIMAHDNNSDADGDGISDGCFYCHTTKDDP